MHVSYQIYDSWKFETGSNPQPVLNPQPHHYSMSVGNVFSALSMLDTKLL